MSNHVLSLKSAFPRAPLQNGVGRYVCQLQRIVLKYCKSNGGSKGMRDFLENRLLEFSEGNPGVVVYVKPRRHRSPVIIGEYLNGERHWLCCRGRSEEEITKWIDLMRTQNCNSSAIRLRKHFHTDVPSVQGPWSPYTHWNPEINTIQFPDKELSKPINLEQTATEKLQELFAKQKIDEKKE